MSAFWSFSCYIVWKWLTESLLGFAVGTWNRRQVSALLISTACRPTAHWSALMKQKDVVAVSPQVGKVLLVGFLGFEKSHRICLRRQKTKWVTCRCFPVRQWSCYFLRAVCGLRNDSSSNCHAPCNPVEYVVVTGSSWFYYLQVVKHWIARLPTLSKALGMEVDVTLVTPEFIRTV